MDYPQTAATLRGSPVNFDAMLAAFRRRLPLFVPIVAAAILIAGLYSLFQTPVYEATARVLIETRTQSLTPDADVMSGLPAKDSSVVDTEVEVLQSRTLARRVVDELELRNDPEFGGSLAESVAKVQDAVDIRRAGETYLIDLVVEAEDPQRAARIANAYAAHYVELQKETKREATASASNLLRERVERMAVEVRNADARLNSFKIANGLMSVNGATLAEQTAATIDQEVARARAQEAEARGRLASLEAAGGTLDVANAQSSLAGLRSEQAAARQALSEAQLKYGERHPAYQAAQARVQQIDEAVASETGRARAAAAATRQQQLNEARAQAVAAAQRSAALSASAGATQGALARNTRAETALGELQRRADAVRATYEAYLNRYKETQTKLGTEQADSRVVANAAPPQRPVKPDLKVNLALGALFGLALGLAAVVLAAVLDPRLSTPAEIESALDIEALPSIATLQTIEEDAERAKVTHPVDYILAEPLSAFAEQFRNLRAAISPAAAGGGSEVVALTSALPSEGKTTTSLCLATVAALSGVRTILIDCDVRHRAVSRYTGHAPKGGLIEVLNGEATLDETISHDARSGVHHLSMSAAPTSPRDHFATDAMASLIDELRRRYDYVILDTAPILPLADTRLLVRHVDRVAMLVRWRDTPRRAVEAALQILANADATIAGVALTLVDLRKQATQGYGDPAFYHRKYKNYYTVTAGQ